MTASNEADDHLLVVRLELLELTEQIEQTRAAQRHLFGLVASEEVVAGGVENGGELDEGLEQSRAVSSTVALLAALAVVLREWNGVYP
jgi:hypothetical protein